jgi:HAD superfamily hydrolase (TIGR01549 family)
MPEGRRGLPRAVLFDFDGTLVDSGPQIERALLATLRAHGYAATHEDGPFMGPPVLDVIERLTGRSGDDATPLLEDYLARYLGEYAPRTEPYQGAVALLDALARIDVPLAIVTNKFERSIHPVLDGMGWASRFGAVIGADTVPHPKPAPDAALEAARRLGVDITACAFVGDSTHDMSCGASAGVASVIGVTTTTPRAALEAAGASDICATIEEAGALLLGATAGAR